MKPQGMLGWAGLFILISGILHIVAPVFTGFSAAGLQLVPIGIVYALLGWGLMRGWSRLACATYLIVLILVLMAFGSMGGAVPIWLTGLIIAADVAGLVALFLYIWRK
ncbi:hypothetical protein [Actibacterium mucosum]|nr:hypothetical protein [Actibacterium mucosum]